MHPTRSIGVLPRSLRTAAALWVLAATACTPPPEPAPRPNVLLVSIDSLRADHVHAYGYERETTPTIDALASEGARFETVLSPTSWTLPAHMTMLTAMPPEQHGVIKSKRALRPRALTLAEVLAASGYATAGFVSGAYLQTAHGYAQGFDVYDTSVLRGKEEEARADITSPEIVRLAQAWLQRWSEEKPRPPFFLFVHLYDVHFDYVPPPPYDTMFDLRAPEAPGGSKAYDQILPGMNRTDLDRILALYDGEIRWTDTHLGHLIDALRALHVLDDTIVVVTSDHGEEFLDHDWRGHSNTLYDEALKVPLVMRYPPKIPAGRVVEEQVRLVDLAPTILGLAGIRAPPKFGSRSSGPHRERDLSPWITSGAPREPFPQLLAFGELRRSRRKGLVSVRAPDAKYIESVAHPDRTQLFRLSSDPAEVHDVSDAAEGAQTASALAEERARWLESLPGREHGLAKRVDLKPKHVDRLRALGYVE